MTDKELKTLKDIVENCPDFISQFYAAVAEIINRNNLTEAVVTEEDGELPF